MSASAAEGKHSQCNEIDGDRQDEEPEQTANGAETANAQNPHERFSKDEQDIRQSSAPPSCMKAGAVIYGFYVAFPDIVSFRAS